MASSTSSAITKGWLDYLKPHQQSNQGDDPNYWASTPENLIASSRAVNFSIGTGSQVFSSILSKCTQAQHELIISTCFWAKSPSQDAIYTLLVRLSNKGMSQNRKIQVRICFSSQSFMQKLFQTSSLDGRVYLPSEWVSLGLPSPEYLRGIELVVKCIFVRPFSVMHSKFILVDRKLAFMPSCNVSWEDWFEGCIEMRGGVAEKLFEFWAAFWSRGGASLPPLPSVEIADCISPFTDPPLPDIEVPETISPFTDPLLNQVSFLPSSPTTETILLPSPHHINPHFIPFFPSTPPPTPLNTFLLHAFGQARNSIYIQTPNLTSVPALNALFSALTLGVSVTIVTSSKLMILEQLVTAGTITEFEIWKLHRRYQTLVNQYHRKLISDNSDAEGQPTRPGTLKIGYYHARIGESEGEPVKSHLKLAIIDEEITVLGSGNMDRASWYTSQELGVALISKNIAGKIRNCVSEALERRVEYVY